MNLFEWGRFTAASGLELDWKVECDALTQADWNCLARLVAPELPRVSEVIGVPNGGIPFADALILAGVELSERELEARYAAGVRVPRLLVDDVWTTGRSMETWMRPGDLGVVAFARGPVPEWVQAVWTLDERLRAW